MRGEEPKCDSPWQAAAERGRLGRGKATEMRGSGSPQAGAPRQPPGAEQRTPQTPGERVASTADPSPSQLAGAWVAHFLEEAPARIPDGAATLLRRAVRRSVQIPA